MALAAGTVAVVIATVHWAPALPGPLIGLALGIALVAVLGLADDGVALVDPIPEGLPALDLPSLSNAPALLAGASGVALIVLVELLGRRARV